VNTFRPRLAGRDGAAIGAAVVVSVCLGIAVPFVPAATLGAVLALVLMLLGLITASILYGTVLSPLGLFAIAWEGGILLADLHLVGYLPISLRASLMIHGSYLAVVLGSVAAGRCRAAPLVVSAPALGKICLALGMIGVVWGLWELNSILGLTAILTQPFAVRTAGGAGDFGTGPPAYLTLLLVPAVVLLRPLSKESLTAIGAAFAWALLSGGRSLALEVAFLAIAVPLLGSANRLQIRHWIIGALVALGALGMFSEVSTLLGKDTLIATYVAQAGTTAAIGSPLLEPYVYGTGGFVAFGQYVDAVDGGLVGLPAIVTPIVRLQGQKENVVYDFRGIPFPFNLYTYLRSWYDAFGPLGTVAGPGLIGFVVGSAYRRRSRSVAWFYLCCITCYGLVGGLFNPVFTYIGTFAVLAFALVIPIWMRLVVARAESTERHALASSLD
jgi:oligosaccharide repeat unit polymerase